MVNSHWKICHVMTVLVRIVRDIIVCFAWFVYAILWYSCIGLPLDNPVDASSDEVITVLKVAGF